MKKSELEKENYDLREKLHQSELKIERQKTFYEGRIESTRNIHRPRRRRQVQQSGCLVAIIFWTFLFFSGYAIAALIK